MSVMVDPKDVKAIYRNLKFFDEKVQAQLEDTVNSHGKAIRRGAKQRVSSRGVRKNAGGRKLDLKSRITMKRAKFSKGKTVVKVISNAPHSHLVEYGTAPHILHKKNKALQLMDSTGIRRYVSRDIQHPGSIKKPFMVPAYMQERNKFLADVTAIVRRETEAIKP